MLMLLHNIYISAMHKVRRKLFYSYVKGEKFHMSYFYSGESAFHAMMHGFGW